MKIITARNADGETHVELHLERGETYTVFEFVKSVRERVAEASFDIHSSELGFDADKAGLVLSPDLRIADRIAALDGAFVWDETPQKFEFWNDEQTRLIERGAVSAEARAWLRECITKAREAQDEAL